MDINRYLLGECLHYGGIIETAEFDVDGNGVPELFISADIKYSPTSHSSKIIDVYSFNGSKAVRLLEDETLGYRSFLKITTDNRVMNYGYGGEYSVCDFYSLSGVTLNFIDGFYTSYEPMSVFDRLTWLGLDGFNEKVDTYKTVEDGFNWVTIAMA